MFTKLLSLLRHQSLGALALFIVLGGTSYAVATNSIGSAQLKNNSVHSADVRDGTLTSSDIRRRTFYTRNESDARYLRGTITVTARSGVNPGHFGGTRANCPAGYEATGGGVSPDNALTMVVTVSEPVVKNTPMGQLPPGQHAAATAWIGFARNNATTAGAVTVIAVCSPRG